jgi:hypothetical protein
MDRWEYKTIKFQTKGFWGGVLEESTFNLELNRYGNEGWEVISCFDTSQHEGISRDVVVVFKRKKEDEITVNAEKRIEYCPACGTVNYDIDRNCRSCGITLIVDEENMPRI